MDQGHWKGIKVDPSKHIGFVYLIHHMPSGKSYIGRKQIWKAKANAKGCRSRVMDISSPKWNPACWVESDWRVYCGSSKNLLAHMAKHPKKEYTFRVLEVCVSKGELTYCEARAQWKYKVLEEKLPNGEYKFFNGQVGAIKFRPKLQMEETNA